MYIIDDNLKLLPPGVQGEIAIAGDGLSSGYIGQPGITAEKFLPNPFAEVAGTFIYRTGDVGYLSANGEIIYQGRRDHQVKIRGHRIELGAIEYALNQLDDIRESVVIVREDRENDQRLTAYVVPQDFDSLTSATELNYQTLDSSAFGPWKTSLQEILPSFMIPGEYVAARQIPRLPNSKIDRSALPQPEQHTGTTNGRMPSLPEEMVVARVWGQVLGRENITLDDDFFDLGGHSLLAVQVITRMETETGKRVPFTALFRASTLEEFSALFSDRA